MAREYKKPSQQSLVLTRKEGEKIRVSHPAIKGQLIIELVQCFGKRARLAFASETRDWHIGRIETEFTPGVRRERDSSKQG